MAYFDQLTTDYEGLEITTSHDTHRSRTAPLINRIIQFIIQPVIFLKVGGSAINNYISLDYFYN